MGILTRAGDLVYAFRFLRLLTTEFKDTTAYKLGLIDEKGKKLKKAKTEEEKSAYNVFHRLVFNVKKLIPGGKLGSYASALYMIKENYIQNEKKLKEVLEDSGIDVSTILDEQTSWFMINGNQLSPGPYRLRNTKLINTNYEELALANHKVIVKENCYPVGNIFGLDIYEVTHHLSNQPVYVTAGELYK